MLKEKRLLYFLAFVRFLLPFFLQHSYYQPHRDEYLYLAEGNHLAWGYMEVPPLISVFAWITNHLGAGMFWIKCWPSLFGSFTFLLVGRIILSLNGKTFALILGWLPFVIDGYMRLFFLFMPNFLDVFFWTAMAFSLVRYVQTDQNKWLYYFGISAGLGMLSKYSVAFYALSLGAALLASPHRRIFFNRHFYFASLLGILAFLPNLLWQYHHRFPVIHHMETLQREQLQFVETSGFLIDQFMMNLPCVFVWVAGLLYLLVNKAGRKYRFVAIAYLVVIALLIILQGKSYYVLGAYPVLFVFGACYLEQVTAMRFKWVRYAMLIVSLSLGLIAFPLILPVAKPNTLVAYYQKTGLNQTGDFKWEDLRQHPLPQDFADMIGWKELALKTGKVYNSLTGQQKKETIVFCWGYFTAGALNYYRPEAGLPEVLSDDASFLFWLPDQATVRHILLVGRHLPGPDDRVFNQFEKITIKDSVDIPLFRETGTKIMFCENGSDSLNPIIEEAIAHLKGEYMRR